MTIGTTIKRFAIILGVVSTRDAMRSRPEVQISIQPKFPCGSQCMGQIGVVLEEELTNVAQNDLEPEYIARNKRDFDSDAICIPYRKTIAWKSIVERDLCAQIRAKLPQCVDRQDDCITCSGNGTYGKFNFTCICPFRLIKQKKVDFLC